MNVERNDAFIHDRILKNKISLLRCHEIRTIFGMQYKKIRPKYLYNNPNQISKFQHTIMPRLIH